MIACSKCTIDTISSTVVTVLSIYHIITVDMDLGPYLKFVSPPRSGHLHEMRFNNGTMQVGQVWNQENDGKFCDNSNTDECLDYLDKVSFQTTAGPQR